MANSDKDILITPNRGQSAEPTIAFTGFDNAPLTLRVLDNGTVSFEATAGQIFSISDGFEGVVYSVNDVSGVPRIEVLDTGVVRLNPYSGNVGIGVLNPSANLEVAGDIRFNGGESLVDALSSGGLSPFLLMGA
jgi:uncharacterized protein YkvS